MLVNRDIMRALLAEAALELVLPVVSREREVGALQGDTDDMPPSMDCNKGDEEPPIEFPFINIIIWSMLFVLLADLAAVLVLLVEFDWGAGGWAILENNKAIINGFCIL